MRHTNNRQVRFGWMVALLLFCGAGSFVHAQEAYTSGDNNFGFKYPKRWRAEAEGDKVHIISPDGNKFLVQQDVLKALPAGPPAYDADVKAQAAQLASKLLPNAELVRAQTAVVDHGAGAVFRFQEKGKGDDASVVAVWVAVIGKHSVVIVPEKAAQAGEAIGLSTVIQSVTFADALPKPPPARPGPSSRNTMGAGTAADAGMMTGGPHTVSFQTQIAPILAQRCRACHNGGSALGGLNVVSFGNFLKGGEHGALVTPGKPDSSLLMDYLTGKRDRMPKGSMALPDDQIGLFRTWIQEGATNDAAGGQVASVARPAAAAGKARQANRPGRTAEASGSVIIEGYTGHLIVTDAGFSLNLHRDGTVTADWTFSPLIASHFTGTYRGKDGTYGVALTLASGSNPYQAKTLVLDLRPRGNVEIGRFGLDTDQPRRDIADLSLTQIDVDFKKGTPSKKNGRPK